MVGKLGLLSYFARLVTASIVVSNRYFCCCVKLIPLHRLIVRINSDAFLFRVATRKSNALVMVRSIFCLKWICWVVIMLKWEGLRVTVMCIRLRGWVWIGEEYKSIGVIGNQIYWPIGLHKSNK